MTARAQTDIKAVLAALADLALWAEAFCERHNVPAKTSFGVQLCLEEAVSNCVRHGGMAPEASIGVVLQLDDDRLVIDITDHGMAYDPLSAPKPVLPQTIEDATIGGLGIELMRRYCREMTYDREGGANHLRLILPLPAANTAR